MYWSSRAQIAHLKVDKASTGVPDKYVDFIDVFSTKFAIKLPKHTAINNHAIKLVDDRQLPYDRIYSLA